MTEKPTGMILLVEDEPSVRSVVETMLKRAGYRVLAAEEADQALKLFLQNRTEVSLAIVDLTLPGKSGSDVIKDLWGHGGDLKVIVTSGLSRDEAATSLEELPGAVYLQKPYRMGTLLTQVRSMLESSSGSSPV